MIQLKLEYKRHEYGIQVMSFYAPINSKKALMKVEERYVFLGEQYVGDVPSCPILKMSMLFIFEKKNCLELTLLKSSL